MTKESTSYIMNFCVVALENIKYDLSIICNIVCFKKTIMSSTLRNVVSFLYRAPDGNINVQQVRHRFADWRMLKDYSKRQDVKKYGKERLRINSLRKNNVLPRELQEIADQEIAALPRRSSISQLENRCCITSRPRGTVNFFRVSRIVFRHLADYNKLAGVQRAMW